MWPSLETASRLYDLANIGLIIGLVIGVVSTIVVAWMGTVKEGYLDRALADSHERTAILEKQAGEAKLAIAEAQTQLAESSVRAANAEQKAAEAKLALEKYKAPRVLTTDGQARVTSKMKAYSDMAFDFASTTSKESLNLLEQIESALISAKWTQLEWTGGSISRNGKTPIGHAIETGVTVQVEIAQKEHLLDVAKALSSALNNEGIAAEAQLMPVPKTANHNAIHIVVGDKPR